MAIEVDRIQPSAAMAEIKQPNSQLVNLIIKGYNLKAEAKKDPIKAASYDYDYPDDRAVVFIAKQAQETVGSVTLILWRDSATDKRGKRFWPKLRELDPNVAKRAIDMSPLACDVGGVVVLPETRGKQIGKSLLLKAASEVKPSIIVGNTKTVEAVALRRKLVDLGYRIFYGDTEITHGHEQIKTKDHETVLKAYLFAKDYEKVLPEGNVFIYSGGITPSIPNTEGFPPIIQEAFKPVIKAQTRIGNEATVMGPLIAIRKEILETKPMAKRISLREAKHFKREGFLGDVFVETGQGRGYNALLVDVHGRHYRTGMKGATRNYFVVEGKGTFTLDGQKYQVEKGDLYIIPNGHDYEYEGEMKLLEFNIPGTTKENEINLDDQK